MSSSDNNSNIKRFATVAGLIVSCIGIFTFFTGYSNLRDMFGSSDERTSANQNVNSSGSQSDEVSVVFPTDTPAPEPYSISGAVMDPSYGSVISSDSPIVVDDYLLTYRHDFYIHSSCINLGDFYIKNLADRKRVFSYMFSSVSIKDDLGNSYSIKNMDDVYELRTLNLDGLDDGKAGWSTSCGCTCSGTGFTYEGSLSPQASS